MASIMKFTKIALRNLVHKPATTTYPAEPFEYFERTRGHIEINFDACILCGMCMRMCPPNAIKVDRAKGDWSISRFDCIQCGYCTLKCPKKCLHLVPGYQEPSYEKSVDLRHKEPPAKPAPKKPVPKPAAAAAAKPAAAPKAAPVAEAVKPAAPKPAAAPAAEAVKPAAETESK